MGRRSREASRGPYRPLGAFLWVDGCGPFGGIVAGAMQHDRRQCRRLIAASGEVEDKLR